MQEKLNKKLLLPLIALAIVSVCGVVYTMSHAGPGTAQAQASNVTATKPADTDKETQDDAVTPGAVNKQATKGKNDTQEASEPPDKNGSGGEVEDGN